MAHQLVNPAAVSIDDNTILDQLIDSILSSLGSFPGLYKRSAINPKGGL